MTTAMPDTKRIMANGLFYALTLLMAFGLKSYYSRAGFGDLVWVLEPTACLTEAITGDAFVREENCGFVSRERGIIIAPACAGVNFLIMAFCMAVFSFVHRFRRMGSKLGWFCASAAGAYALTIAVNAVRISISTQLRGADIYSGWITYERVHRFEGVVVYFLFLYLFYAAIRLIIVHGKHASKTWFLSAAIPLLSYIGVAVGVPVANFAFRKDPVLFAEHCAVVISVSVGLCLMLLVLHTGFGHAFRRVVHKIGEINPKSQHINLK